MLKKNRPAILHLEDSEWDKRCDLIKFLFPDCEVPDASAGITAAEKFFCYCSLRGKDGSVDYGHSHGVIGRTLMETAGEHAAILYNSADGRIVCVMLLANLSLPKRNAAQSDHFA